MKRAASDEPPRKDDDDDDDDDYYLDDDGALHLPTTVDMEMSGARADLLMFVSNHDWPSHTHEPCLYCLHSFTGMPVGLPVSFDERTRKYRLHGFFCSMACANSYLLRECTRWTPSERRRLEMFQSFARAAFGYSARNPLPEAPPLEQLCKLIGDQRRSGVPEQKARELAIATWRKDDNQYANVRKVPNMFVRVAQIFEQQNERQRELMRRKRHADLMRTQEPRPVVLTEHGQREQMKYVRKKMRGESQPKPGAIDAMMGIRRTTAVHPVTVNKV